MKEKIKKFKQTKFYMTMSKYPTSYLIPIFLIVFLILQGIATKGWDPNSSPYNPVALKISKFEIKWYAVFIITGIIYAIIISVKEFEKLKMSKEDLYTGVLIIVPLSIIGSRLYYVIFDNEGTYKTFGDVFNMTTGGLAIHGAIIVASISGFIYCKIKKMNIFTILDLLAIGFLIGQILGRWGNFMNQEAHGPLINASNPNNPGFLAKFPFAPFVKQQMFIQNAETLNSGIVSGYFHPTFLYESMLNLVLLISLLIIRRFRLLKLGDMFGMYLIWYGLVRGFAIEPIRQDPLHIGSLEVNIVFSLLLFSIGGIIYLITKYIFYPNLDFYYDVSQGLPSEYIDPKAKKTKKEKKKQNNWR